MDALSEAASAASATQANADETKAEQVGAKEAEPASAPPETKSEIQSEAASAEKIAPGGAAEGLSQDESSTQSADGQKGGAEDEAVQNGVTAPEGAAADGKVEPKVESAAAGGGGGEPGGEPGGEAAKADAEEREMELTSYEQGLKGSWFPCMASATADPKTFSARYEGEGASTELVAKDRLRPRPPDAPAGWEQWLRKGDRLELLYDDGWWQVTLLDHLGEDSWKVLAKEYNAAHVVETKRLRPGWTHADDDWAFELGGTRRPLGVWREVIASGPPPSAAPPAEDCGSDFAASPTAGDAGGEGPPLDAAEERFAGFKWGMAVEVAGVDAGLKGSWSPCEVMKVLGEGELDVQWVLPEGEGPTQHSDPVAGSRVRPAAPVLSETRRAAWEARISPGSEVELYYVGSWWEVVVQERSADKFNVYAPLYTATHKRVPVSKLRPRYTWRGWRGGWGYNEGGMRIELPPTAPTTSHVLPGGKKGKGKGPSPGAVVTKNEYLEVEVAETIPPDAPEGTEPEIVWKVSKVTSLVANSNRFTCCVNGEGDFVEEYGPEDENSEWRRVPDQVAAAAAYKLAEKLFVQKEQREKREAEEAEVRRLEELAKEQAAAAEAEAANAPAAEAPAAAGKKRKNPPKAEGGTTKAAKKAPAATTTAKVTASGKPPGAPPSAPSYRFGFGMAVEVRGHEEGMHGSWYAGEVLAAHEKVRVQYDELYEPGSGEGPGANVTEWVASALLRPAPPAPADDWLSEVEPGAPLEFNHDSGWWQVELVAAADGATAADATQLLVRGAQWGEDDHMVPVESVRPGWQWERGTNTWGRRKKSAGASSSAASRGAGGGRGAKAARGAGAGARGKAR